MSGTKAEGDGIIRTDFPGGWAGDQKMLSLLRTYGFAESSLGLYEKIIELETAM